VAVAAAVALLAAAAASARAAVSLSKVGDFAAPTYVTAPAGDPDALYVVERAGRIVVQRNGVASTFLDISADVKSGGEQGLLSMAFAPDYAQSGRFYVYYTAVARAGVPDAQLRVEEVRRSAGDPYVADPATRRLVISQDHPTYANHNGGQLQFGPDGKLWVGMGDGGGGGDPGANAQSLGTLLGKILRLEPSGAPAAGNPFAGSPGARAEIWAYGLRNPWRFSFDRATGDLVIADVGQGSYEEIDFAGASAGRAPGANYGWNCREGLHPYSGGTCAPAPLTDPVLEYPHSSSACSISGGYVVRDPGLPSLLGRYVYGDFCGPGVRSVALGPPAAGDRAEDLPVPQISSFGEDGCGHVYVASLGGTVYRLVEGAPAPCPGGTTSPGMPSTSLPAAADVQAPRVSVHWPAATTLRRGLRGRVRCDEACTVTVSARVAVAGRSALGLRTRRLRLVAGRWRTLTLRPSAAAGRVLRRDRRAHRRMRVRVRVSAADAAGNRAAGVLRRIRVAA
jgi:glucose/arabinose dehydrogenase